MDEATYLAMTADIVAAFISNSTLPSSDLPVLISSTHKALKKLDSGKDEPVKKPGLSAVLTNKSITPDFLICLEDSLKTKSLKRHLQTKCDLSPYQYRGKWGFARDYSMVSPNHAETRSFLASPICVPPKGCSVRS